MQHVYLFPVFLGSKVKFFQEMFGKGAGIFKAEHGGNIQNAERLFRH